LQTSLLSSGSFPSSSSNKALPIASDSFFLFSFLFFLPLRLCVIFFPPFLFLSFLDFGLQTFDF